MWTEDELPDVDLESVYGHQALSARINARVDRLITRVDDQRRLLEAMARRPVTPEEPVP